MVIPLTCNLLPRTMFWWPYLGYDWIRDWQICISKGDKGEKRFNYKMSVVSSCVLVMFFTEQVTSWKYLKVQCRAYLRYILQNNLKIHMYVIYGFFFLQNRKCSVGTKPCLLFSGQAFENDAIYKRLKSILIGGLTHWHCHGDVMMQNCHRFWGST